MDGGAWWAAVYGVEKSRTQLSDFTFSFHFPALEKEMATHSSVLAWRIPGTGKAEKDLAVIYIKECFSFFFFPSKNFLLSSLTFRFLIHFEFIFVYGVR